MCIYKDKAKHGNNKKGRQQQRPNTTVNVEQTRNQANIELREGEKKKKKKKKNQLAFFYFFFLCFQQ
jgi:hypothetical protein